MKRFKLATRTLIVAIMFLTFSSNIQAEICNPLNPLNCIMELFYSNDGVVDPDLQHMRYRYQEYDATAPFYQWWYYTIKDYDTNTEFAFDISQSIGPDNSTNDGTYVMFSMVQQSSSTKFHKYDRWTIPDMDVQNNGQPGFKIQIPVGNNPDFKIDFQGNGVYHLTGKMDDPAKVWFSDGSLNGVPVNPNTVVEWDLTVYRIYGFYAQQDMENELKDNGIISWNTYAHTSEVEGTIIVNGVTYTFQRTPRYRAYCDMNWGENFPKGLPSESDVDYPWGWYYVNLPNSNPGDDIGIIAGIGRHNAPNSLFGITEGHFADIRLPGGEHIGTRKMDIWKQSPTSDGYTIVGTASDGDVYNFSVERSEWTSYADSVGTAQIPYRQIVSIETTTRRVTLDFQSVEANYNRLLFPHQDYIFSDFEGLGVTCHVVIESIDYYWWWFGGLVPFYTVEYDFITDDAGLEYGYDTSDTNYPGVFD